MIKGINHIGISVSDLDRAIDFYCKLLNMSVVVRRVFEGEQYERLLALKDTRGTVALLRSDSAQIELFEFTSPSPRQRNGDRPVCDHGITHICIEVDDIESEFRRLKAGGVRFHCEPEDFAGAAKAIYGRDPDGNVFELLELHKTAPLG